jgi:ethanolamine utilization protein EutA
MAGGDDKPESGHTLADHMFGDYEPHEHGPDADHDHDEFELPGPIEDHPIWLQDNVTLQSVGIDIGSAGTQVVFSRVHLRRLGEELTSRYFVIARETFYQSPVRLTPYSDEQRIDDRALGAIIDDAYAAARIHPDDIDTGVVILTGEALRRDNAEGIAEILAERGGEFVCATAGHHMEAMLAAYGSGAARVSHETGRRLLNVDMGGGTTKLAIVEAGRVVATAALHIGGRLQVTDEAGLITRLDLAGRSHARAAGFDWHLGDIAHPAELDRVAAGMADALIAALCTRPLPEAAAQLYLTDPLPDLDAIEGVMFSGGVAEYVYHREVQDFGDMGRRLGHVVRARLDGGALPWPLLPAGECIRATALGASEYSVQLSGNTSYISSPRLLLPRRNLQVLQPDVDLSGPVRPDTVAAAIRAHLTAFDLDDADTDLALAFSWAGMPDYERISAFAKGIRQGVASRIDKGLPLYIMLEGDIAMTLGGILHQDWQIGCDTCVIDGITLRDFDYIDLGRIRVPSLTVPVTIKSLVFNEDPRGPRRSEHHHHHRHHHHHGQGHNHHGSHGPRHQHHNQGHEKGSADPDP